MKILAFAASNSTQSINKKLVTYTANLATDCQIEILDLNDYELPLFSEDKEKILGKPQLAQDFFNKIGSCDALIISFAEHNGNYSAAYKNIFDWASRIDAKVFQNKPMLILSTSSGAGGAANVMSLAINSAPHFKGVVIDSVSVPSFYKNYDAEQNTINNSEIQKRLLQAVQKLIK
ncbi:MAG: NAD(P)H-dependent oxidoreductase [Proteobacteria bacterium]|nr:NAD(P)H-dependent oxidoreductase [Pseudomonadota bacterium]